VRVSSKIRRDSKGAGESKVLRSKKMTPKTQSKVPLSWPLGKKATGRRDWDFIPLKGGLGISRESRMKTYLLGKKEYLGIKKKKKEKAVSSSQGRTFSRKSWELGAKGERVGSRGKSGPMLGESTRKGKDGGEARSKGEMALGSTELTPRGRSLRPDEVLHASCQQGEP